MRGETCLDFLKSHERPKGLLRYNAGTILFECGHLFFPDFRYPAEAGETKVQQFRPQRNMLSSLFSKIFADEEPADDKEATKAEEATQEKTEGTPAEAAEEEAEEPEDVSYHRQAASKNR